MKRIASKPIKNNHKQVISGSDTARPLLPTNAHSQHNAVRFRFPQFIKHWRLLPVLMLYRSIKRHSHSYWNRFGSQNLHSMNANFDQLCHITNISPQ